MSENNVVTLPTAISEVRDQLKHVMDEDRKVTQTRLAKEIGVSTTVVSQWLGGTYPGDNASVEHKLGVWLTKYRHDQTAAARMPAAPDWVETPSALRVLAALGYAQVAGDIAIVYGGAGLGKTSAVRRYASGGLNVWVATMTPSRSSVVMAMEEIAEAVGAGNTVGGAAKLFKAVTRKVAGSAGLLVIDEAQHLSIAAMDEIRSIHDATGIGIALVGNEQVYARMTGNRAAFLDRLHSRIGKRVRLTQSTNDDIFALIRAWGIDDAECRPALVEIAKRPGGLRGLTKVLRLASMHAAAAGHALCCTDVRSAWRDLAGE